MTPEEWGDPYEGPRDSRPFEPRRGLMSRMAHTLLRLLCR